MVFKILSVLNNLTRFAVTSGHSAWLSLEAEIRPYTHNLRETGEAKILKANRCFFSQPRLHLWHRVWKNMSQGSTSQLCCGNINTNEPDVDFDYKQWEQEVALHLTEKHNRQPVKDRLHSPVQNITGFVNRA